MTIRPLIDWSCIASAMEHYQLYGYRAIEVPWLIDPASSRVTFNGSAFEVRNKVLLGSAEQGFYEVNPPIGRYVSCSPCFRNDPIDDLHQQDFMKVELYQTDDISDWALRMMIRTACDFFEKYISVQIVETPDGFDIEHRGIELGSYGRRTVGDRIWLYGTGVALPRLTVAQTVPERSMEVIKLAKFG